MPSDQFRLTKSRVAVLQVSVLVVALCGIVYELLIATVSSYLLGDSVRQFSGTIGLFMAAMGLGAYITRFVNTHLIARFVIIEILVALVGGLSTVILFLVFPWSGFYQPTMYGLIIIIGTLVGMNIPLLTRVLSETGDIRRSIADVLSLDYLGALIGSVAFPLFLLPFLGLAVLQKIILVIFLPGANTEEEISRDRNLNIAWIGGTMSIGIATFIFFLL